MKLLKQNFLNLTFINNFAIKKVLNVLLYNKILVRTFDVKSSKKDVAVVKRSTMLKIIGDNYLNFFLFSEKKIPQPYFDFISLNKKKFDKASQHLKNIDHLYSFKILKNQFINTGYSYKVNNIYLNNYDQRYSKLLHKHIAYLVPKKAYLQELKKKIDSFLTLSKVSNVILLLSPKAGGYISYSRGFLGVIGFKQLKFFLTMVQKKKLLLQKFKLYTALRCQITYDETFKFLFYFQTKMLKISTPFLFSASIFDDDAENKLSLFKMLMLNEEKKLKEKGNSDDNNAHVLSSLKSFQKWNNSLTIEKLFIKEYFK